MTPLSSPSSSWQLSAESACHYLQTLSLKKQLTSEDETFCENACSLLKDEEAFSYFNNPLHYPWVLSQRHQTALSWGHLNTLLEYYSVEKIWKSSLNYADFCSITNKHWLYGECHDLLNGELDLLTPHPSLMCGKVCILGPGAVPYTGLAFLSAGAQVTFVDMFDGALTWCQRWVKRFFPLAQASYIHSSAQHIDYSSFDLVIIASMLTHKNEIFKKISLTPPHAILMRTTENNRPLGLIEQMISPDDYMILTPNYDLHSTTNPPLSLANISQLFLKKDGC
ncbi:MAG: hypothetical protein COY40_00065 [Alphaproteobacteria bacterium CG_4_10_14_0_8_um_filter_53_9]|nr:MAG: hypothetical protein COY40_00065 [Alphaproteobacteria bacterium CG_4_10_14_0_8_um_filter_53_9]